MSFELPIPESPRWLQPNEQLTNCVVGAGPAGLLTAILLAKEGLDVVVIEGRERPTQFFGSFPVVLNSRGLQALSRFSAELVARFKELGRPVDEIHIVPNNRTVARAATFGVCIMRDQAVGLLLEACDRLAIPIHYQHKLLDIDLESRLLSVSLPGGETVSVGVRSCLVGADGNYSKVRRCCEAKAGLSVETQPWGVTMRYMLAPDPPQLPSSIDGRVHYVLGSDGYVCQQPDGQWSFSIGYSEGEPNAGLLSTPAPTAEAVASLRALCTERATPFAQHLLTSDETCASYFNCKPFNGQLVKVSTLAPAAWVALIGDAAHAVAPYTGEGINSALESASILAATLARGGDAAAFDAERREDAHAVYELAKRNKVIVSGEPEEKAANTAATILLGIGKSVGLVKGTLADYQLGRRMEHERVRRYSELVALDQRQRAYIYPAAKWLFKHLLARKPAPEATAAAAEAA